MSEKEAKSPLSRRNFLGIAWAGSLTLVFAQAVFIFVKFLKPLSSGGYGGQVFAGKLENFAVDSVHRISSGRFYISRTPEGLIALWQKCPHLGCAISWDEELGEFHCPCHGSTFNRVGDVLGGPAPTAMYSFPIEVTQEEVWVDTGNPVSRITHDPSHVTDA